MRIAVSPERRWSLPDLADLEAHAERLNVIVSTARRGKLCIVRVRRGNSVLTLRGEGTLDVVIAGALDDFETHYGEPWTSDEILTIAAQSGIEVRRA